MPDIGIRELKTKASQIVRNIRKRRVRYIVTLRGRPVAKLVPLDEPILANLVISSPSDDAWNELTRLGKEMAKSWPPDAHSSEVLSDMRR